MPRTSGRSVATIAAGALAVAAFLVLPEGGAGQTAAFGVPFLMSAVLLGRRVLTTAEGRTALALLWVGQALYGTAMVVWFALPVVAGRSVPFPSVLDAFFLVSFALYAAFLVVVLRRRAADRGVESRLALTDSLVVTCSAMALVWVVVIDPAVTVDQGIAALVVTAAYPAANVLLLTLATRLAITGSLLRTAPGVLLVAWVGSELAGDLLYGAQVAQGTFRHTGALTTTWMVAYTALAALAVHPRLPALLERCPDRPGGVPGAAPGRRVRHVLLLAATLVPLALIAAYPEHRLLLVVAAVVTSVLVSARFLLLMGDLGEQRRLAEELESALAELRERNTDLTRYAAIVASTDDSVVTIGADGRVVQWNEGATRLFGYGPDDARTLDTSQLIGAEARGAFADVVDRLRSERHLSIETLATHRDGHQVPVLVGLSALPDEDGQLSVVAIARDITERKAIEARLADHAAQMQRMAFQDPLTGLGNRALFLRRVAELQAAAAPDALAGIAVLMLDLDDFKYVNDSLGHETGDALLAAAAARLGDVVGEEGTVTRLGGDEFTVVLPTGGEDAGVDLAERILTAFGRDFHVLGFALRTTTSIGITSGAAGGDATSLLRSADLAMYAAKAAGKGTVRVYREDLLLQAQERLRLESHLRHAAQREELRLEYQPIVDARTGTLAGLEALARWEHPTWGLVPPATFIPVAETSGSILVIGEWVLRTACRQAVAVAAQHGREIGMSVNVSVRQLHTEGFVDVVRDALATSGLAPSLLTLEVTESLFLSEDPAVTAALDELGSLGVQLSIDDFGTGHSALARLRVLPVSELKIDRSFVQAIGPDGGCGAIVDAILAMARALDLSVVAEGVETPAQRDALRGAGCDRLQGFLLARPMPPARLGELRSPGWPGGGRDATAATA